MASPHAPHTHAQGADFGREARQRIEDKLRSGLTLAQIEFQLKNPGAPLPPAAPAATATATVAAPPKEEKKKEEKKEEKKKEEVKKEEPKAAKVEVAPPPPPPPPPPPAPVEVGKGLGVASRNPLDMVKVRRVTSVDH